MKESMLEQVERVCGALEEVCTIEVGQQVMVGDNEFNTLIYEDGKRDFNFGEFTFLTPANATYLFVKYKKKKEHLEEREYRAICKMIQLRREREELPEGGLNSLLKLASLFQDDALVEKVRSHIERKNSSGFCGVRVIPYVNLGLFYGRQAPNWQWLMLGSDFRNGIGKYFHLKKDSTDRENLLSPKVIEDILFSE